MWLTFLFLTLLSFMYTPQVQAFSDPLEVANNKYGIHIIDANDITKAVELVNSHGGEWGYVTIVITQTDRNIDKWQGIFDELRRKKLIPLLRVATQVDNGVWRRSTPEEVSRWADFLNSLNWPVSNRYVIIFNEPNHAKEWGGEINPEGYAQVLRQFADVLHGKSENFFVLPAGFDTAASSDGASLDAFTYLKRMQNADPKIWETIDGWTSHSYPNPGFSAAPTGWGKGSIRSYRAELDFLKSNGVERDLPVFITETGWQHAPGKLYNPGLLSTDTVARYIITAANEIWDDKQIVAVTPFLLNYPDFPFDHFSWIDIDNPNEWYSHALSYQTIVKSAGRPKQKVEAQLSSIFFPRELVGQSVYTLEGELSNSGENIFAGNYGSELTLSSTNSQFNGFFAPLGEIEPGGNGPVRLFLKTPGVSGSYDIEIKLKTDAGELVLLTDTIAVIPPPQIELNVQLGWQKISFAKGVTALIYDQHEQLIFKKVDLTLNNGKLLVDGLYGIVPGGTYRVVVLVRGYLPRQVVSELETKTTTINLERFYPLDADLDGAFTKNDFYIILRTSPAVIWQRFF